MPPLPATDSGLAALDSRLLTARPLMPPLLATHSPVGGPVIVNLLLIAISHGIATLPISHGIATLPSSPALNPNQVGSSPCCYESRELEEEFGV